MLVEEPIHGREAKKPLYVEIYEKLFQLIEDKKYHEGDRLPGENRLSIELGVSRTTLRQALILMTEDGIIHRDHGKGNFIANLSPRNPMGLENIANPVATYNTVPIQEINIDIRFEAASEYVMKLFGYQQSRVVMASDRWYRSDSRLVACCFAFTDLATVSTYNIDIQDAEMVKAFLEKTIYDVASHAPFHINITNRKEFSNANIQIDASVLILLSETLYSSEGKILTHDKYYLDPSSFDLVVNGRHMNRI
jgi:DNA-binding GntR family transcriptional regulator